MITTISNQDTIVLVDPQIVGQLKDILTPRGY
jgi:hypothetical protein